jgi:hypothetical protein
MGADAVQLTGLAARCDWVVVSDTKAPEVALRQRHPGENPTTVFLSLRNPFAALAFFAAEVLPRLEHPFVLISGSEDVTLPLQCDSRWRAFTGQEEELFWQIASHPQLRCWWAENLDWAFAPTIRPLPLGLLPGAATEAALLPAAECPTPVQERELLVLCAHRLRPGPQWRGRQQLADHLRGLQLPWLLVETNELPAAAFAALLRRCSFVICASGGGWDPCPKLWHALLHGAIPIVRSSALNPVWQQLPVWVVDRWDAVDWSLPALERQRAELAQRWPAQQQLLHALSLDGWWQQIVASLEASPADETMAASD